MHKKILKLIIAVMLIALSMLMITACGEENTTKKVSGYVNVYPEIITGNLHNPGMGWVALEEASYVGKADVGGVGNLPMVDVVSMQTSWYLIEKEEGVFDWSYLDYVMDYWISQGKRINIRITVDATFLTYTYNACPLWLIEKYDIPTKRYEAHGNNPVGYYDCVDVTNEDYLRHLDIFLNELNEKIKDKPAVENIDLLGYGVWGEWHSGCDFESYDHRHAALSNVIDHWAEVFGKREQFLSLCYAWEYRSDTVPNVNINQTPAPTYEEYLYWSAFDYAMQQDNIAFKRNGGAGVLMYNYDKRLASDYMRSNKYVPLMAEYFSSFDDQLAENPVFDIEEGIDDILFMLRPNYCTVLGWANINVPKLYELGVDYLYARGNEKFGYRFTVDSFKYPETVKNGEEFTVAMQISNSALGRYWLDHKLKISLLDSEENEVYGERLDVNLKTLVNGEQLNVYPKLKFDNLASGEYTIAVSIADSDGNNVVAFGNGGRTEKGYYAMGKISVGEKTSGNYPVKRLSLTDARKYVFKKNTAYVVSLEYLPKYDLADYEFTNKDGYVFSVGNGDKICYSSKWQDVNQTAAYRTFRFMTDGYDCTMDVRSDNFGDIDIGKVYIEEIGGEKTTFEGEYNLTSGKWSQWTYDAFFDDSFGKIRGETSLCVESDVKGRLLPLMSKGLKKGNVYTLSFDTKTYRNTGNGGYFFVSLGADAETAVNVFEWYERPDSEARSFAFSFRVENDGDRLFFGIKNKGGYLLDDLVLTCECEGNVIEGEDIPEEENISNASTGTFGSVEGFEDRSFNRSMYAEGYIGNQWGRLTLDENEVISGEVSAVGACEDNVIGSSWEYITFLDARSRNLAMRTGEAYRISFKYRVMSRYEGALSQRPFFYVLAKPESLGLDYQCDQGMTRFGQDDALGEIHEMSVDVYLAPVEYNDNGKITVPVFEDYIFQFGMYGYNRIIIDDIVVTKLGVPDEFSGVIDFESESAVLEGISLSHQFGRAEIVDDGIDGKSMLIYNDAHGLDSWSTNAYTVPERIAVTKDTRYTVSFDYEIVRAIESGSVGFQVYVHSNSLGSNTMIHSATTRFGVNEAVGHTGKVEFSFVSGEYDDYSLYFGMNGNGACLLDNITIVAE